MLETAINDRIKEHEVRGSVAAILEISDRKESAFWLYADRPESRPESAVPKSPSAFDLKIYC